MNSDNGEPDAREQPDVGEVSPADTIGQRGEAGGADNRGAPDSLRRWSAGAGDVALGAVPGVGADGAAHHPGVLVGVAEVDAAPAAGLARLIGGGGEGRPGQPQVVAGTAPGSTRPAPAGTVTDTAMPMWLRAPTGAPLTRLEAVAPAVHRPVNPKGSPLIRLLTLRSGRPPPAREAHGRSETICTCSPSDSPCSYCHAGSTGGGVAGDFAGLSPRGEVEGNADGDDAALEQQHVLDEQRGLVVERLLPPAR